MNSKYLFSSFAAAALLAVGCTVEQIGGDLEEIKIDNTIVSLPEKGGDATLNLTAAGTWHLDESTLNLVDVEVEDPANPGSTVTEKRPWLKVTPSSGEAGEFEIVFSADAAELGCVYDAADEQRYFYINHFGLRSTNPGTCVHVSRTTKAEWLKFVDCLS